MLTVEQLVEELQKYPRDALVYAYEGEITGIVIVSAHKDEYGGREELGYIDAADAEHKEEHRHLWHATASN